MTREDLPDAAALVRAAAGGGGFRRLLHPRRMWLEVVMPGMRLTFHERQTIERCYALGLSQGEIAVAIGRSQSTVSRELARNGGRGTSFLDPGSRSLLKVTLPGPYEERQPARDIVERLMGRDPAKRFEFIQNRAAAVDEGAIDA